MNDIVFEGRHWTVAEVEEVMWSVRAAGGTDDTVIEGIGQIRAETPSSEVLRRVPECAACGDTGVLPGPGKACPVCGPERLSPGLLRAARVAGFLIALPLVLLVLVFVWGLFLGVVT